jgi:serine/threonine-protein kinase
VRDLAPGDVLAGFRIEETLADGELVRIFRAVSEQDGETVALKVVQREHVDDEILRRFEREARIATRVRHPNLVAVLASGEDEGMPYMAMRFVPGRTLTRVIEEQGPLAPEPLVQLIAEVGAALDALHEQGIVHRDVRSSNILIDDGGTAALTDFGFARGQADTRITQLHRPVGTLDYRAPELFLGKPAERRSDVYSLGCVAYEALVGVPPFAERRELIDLGRAHLQEAPPDPVDRRPDVPPQFATSILSALAKEPGRRPPSGASYAKLVRFELPA